MRPIPTEHKLQIGHWFVERLCVQLRNKELTFGSEKKKMLGTHHQIKKTN